MTFPNSPPTAKPGGGPANVSATPATAQTNLELSAGLSGLNLSEEAFRRGRFNLNHLEAAFDKLPVLASGSQAALRGVDLQELVRLILACAAELRAQAQAAQKGTDLVFLNIRAQRSRCAEILFREEFTSGEKLREVCAALGVPAAPETGDLGLLQKLNRQLVDPATATPLTGYIQAQALRIQPQTQQLLSILQSWAQAASHPAAQVAALNKLILLDIFPAAFNPASVELDRAAVALEIELATSAEATQTAAFREGDFKDQALPEVARLLGMDLTPREKDKDLPDKEILEALNRRLQTGDWLKSFRIYLVSQRSLSELASRLHNAIIRYPHAQLFLGRRLLLEVLDRFFVKKPEAEAGFSAVVFCPAYEADYHHLDLKHVPFQMNLTADGKRSFARYMHAEHLTLLRPDNKGYRIDMGKPAQVERLSLDEQGTVRAGNVVSTNRLEVDIVRMRAASLIVILAQLHQKLLGVTQNQLLAGMNALTAEEKLHLEKLLQPLLVSTGELYRAELAPGEQIFALGPLLGLTPAPDETVDRFLARVNSALNDYRCLNNLTRYCKSQDLYARYEKPLRELERMRTDGKPMEDLALKLKGLLRQLQPEVFSQADTLRFEDLLAGYEDISAFLKTFFLRHSYVLNNLGEFVAGWQDTLSVELTFIRRAGA